jgi:hypothetical protein
MVEHVLCKGECEDLTVNDALCEAAYQGNLELVKYLVSKGATDYDRAVMRARKIGHLDVIRFLVTKGAKSHDANTVFDYHPMCNSLDKWDSSRAIDRTMEMEFDTAIHMMTSSQRIPRGYATDHASDGGLLASVSQHLRQRPKQRPRHFMRHRVVGNKSRETKSARVAPLGETSCSDDDDEIPTPVEDVD